ncbi:Nucleotide-diphospho-sugar transferase [Seminavis robusta]|uniref:Nucleotide-diphospho-sugar transferase n=1 Tax=Seminavis robusta TaxID=568900 RepID=A0A9N8E8R2_9STRA|nr:Nucleotide-diphospho-sugar transferase [Seminavis robusta]|eukprot:Sro672_g185060.1 Nucleotide-diphospho-sugar transferase (600) ;mRNA; f:25575-27963
MSGITNPMRGHSSRPQAQSIVLKYKAFATHLLVGAVCFYAGIGVGVRVGFVDCKKECLKQESNILLKSQLMAGQRSMEEKNPVACDQKSDGGGGGGSSGKRFPDNMSHFLTGMAQFDRDKFNTRFDVGVPLDPSSRNNDKVVLLYNDPQSLPDDPSLVDRIIGGGDPPEIADIEQATKNCDVLDLILVQPKTKRQCMAMVGQYQSFHIQKFMRLPPTEGEKLDSSAPLRLLNRGAQASGRLSAKPPTKVQTLQYWNTLKVYLDTLESVLNELKPIAERVAKQNTIIVMVCNHGQSELLMNFVCAAKSRNLDISTVLVFATDMETQELAEGLGLAVFYDKTNYASAPKNAARSYGDRAFTAMMMAKVYCVQMVAFLGYDVLFQDVDMVWFKDPLKYFHDENSPSHGFDIYFQDDGSRGIFWAPFSANTGFYYVRANDRTRNFFNALLMAGDLIVSTKSHQIALVALLSEHTSLHGMKAKVLSRDADEFPCGHAFHYRKDFMRDIFAGKVEPYIFHMSWTLNKDNKQKFFRQIGEWYLKDQCVASTVDKILDKGTRFTQGSLLEPCCSAEALFSCFYSDKPSKYPCKDSPTIDKGGRPFWK